MSNAPRASASAAATAPTPAALRVLIVEDDTDIRETMAELLIEEGYEVLTASSGRDALELLQHCGALPELVLLDLMMPVMDGWTFYDELQKEPGLASLPIVVVSADANAQEKSARLNPAACLRKPVSIDELLSTVARFRRTG